jgi:hypothetical protein
VAISFSVPAVDAAAPISAGRYRLDDFRARWETEFPWVRADTDGVWRRYVDDFAEYAGPKDVPLTRNQLFRQLGAMGIKRFRSGKKDNRGKRPYLYQLVMRGRPRRRPRRSMTDVYDGVVG